jgi:ribulose bisphosphate carboxylase small subunit
MAQQGKPLSRAEKYNFSKIRNLVEAGLMHDWAIRIEYASKTPQNEIEWLQWDKTLFAIREPDQVLEKLKECCSNHPDCSMKLVCEHFSPESRLVYCIQKHGDAGEVHVLKPGKAAAQSAEHAPA